MLAAGLAPSVAAGMLTDEVKVPDAVWLYMPIKL